MTDSKILTELIKGNAEDVFEELFNLHRGMVYSVCLRILNDQHLAEDAMQKTFLLLFQKTETLTNKVNLPGWLHRAAVLISKNIKRSLWRKANQEKEIMVMNEIDQSADNEILWASVKPYLDEAVNQLSDKLRQVIILCYLDGKSRREVAEILKCSENTLSKRVNRGLEKLQLSLKKRGVALSVALLGSLLINNSLQAHTQVQFKEINEMFKHSKDINLSVKLLNVGGEILFFKKMALLILLATCLALPVSMFLIKNFNRKENNTTKNYATGVDKIHTKRTHNKKNSFNSYIPPDFRDNREIIQIFNRCCYAKNDDIRYQIMTKELGIAISRKLYDEFLADLREYFPNDNFIGENAEGLIHDLSCLWATHNPEAYIAWRQSLHGPLPDSFPAWSIKDFLITLNESDPLTFKRLVNSGMFEKYFDEDSQKKMRQNIAIFNNPEKALNELIQKDIDPSQKRKMHSILFDWFNRNPLEACQWIDKNFKGTEKAELLKKYTFALEKLDEKYVLNIINSVPEKFRHRLMLSYANSLFHKSPEAALDIYKRMDFSDTIKREDISIARNMVRNITRFNPSVATEFVMALPMEFALETQVYELLSRKHELKSEVIDKFFDNFNQYKPNMSKEKQKKFITDIIASLNPYDK